jgi:2-oxo-4-hydroxy-4-carboxy-5-ureidoimidazoline decarboxylase
MERLSWLDTLPEDQARAELARCCGSARWVEGMLKARPFRDADTLFEQAERVWASLARQDWLEAFACHPRIGDKEALRRRFAATAGWAAGEQAGALAASDGVLEALAQGNRDYEKRFGWIFIVCAAGRSAEEMLAILRSRLGNPPDLELKVAAAEQAKITRLRLEKLLTA